MDLEGDPTTNVTHGFTLLRELNSQRRMGEFCDCVIQLHSHPGNLFLAHKSVLAAFSPVLASLLPRHGTLMDLNISCLTPETLDNLLEYIYTGSLPPQCQEKSVLSAAFYLQMEQLQQAMGCREKSTEELTVPAAQDKLSQQTVDEDPPVSPPHYPYGSAQPTSSSPTYEVVPVICHVRASGNDKHPLLSHWHDQCSAHGAECSGRLLRAEEPSHCGDPRSPHKSEKSPFSHAHFPETSRSKRDKVLAVLSEGSPNDPQRVVSEEVEGQSGDEGQLGFILSENASHIIRALHPNTDHKDLCMEGTQTTTKNVAPAIGCHQDSNQSCPQPNTCASRGISRCVSDINSFKSLNISDSGKGDHLVKMFSEAFNDKISYNITGTGSTDESHCCGQFATSDVPLCVENSSSTDTSDMTCERRSSDPDVWPEVSQLYTQRSTIESHPSGVGVKEQGTVDEDFKSSTHAASCELLIPRSNDMHVYQGQVRYHCLLERPHAVAESSDSDGDRRAEPAMGRRSKPRPFQCSLCERLFSQRGSLNRHVRSHLGVRPYSCPRCAMTFSRQYRVTEHMRVHQRTYEGPPPGNLRNGDMQVDV